MPPLNITFRDMESTPALENLVHEQAERLEHVFDRIERCDVVIDRPHQSQLHGQQFHVRVALAVPGSDIVANRGSNDDAYLAIREAFRAARRQLEDHAQHLRDHHADAHALR